MFVSAVILYFGETPAGYDLFKTDEGFALKPPLATTGKQMPPPIAITSSIEGWQVEGITSEDLRQQVLRLIELTEVIDLQGKLSAAS